MTDPDSRKEFRRNKIKNNHKGKMEFSDEQKFVKKAKHQHKKHIEDMRAEEVWEDWEGYTG